MYTHIEIANAPILVFFLVRLVWPLLSTKEWKRYQDGWKWFQQASRSSPNFPGYRESARTLCFRTRFVTEKTLEALIAKHVNSYMEGPISGKLLVFSTYGHPQSHELENAHSPGCAVFNLMVTAAHPWQEDALALV